MEAGQKTGRPLLRHDWKLLAQPQVLTVAAIGGYLCLIPVQTDPDLATFLLISLGLLAANLASGLKPGLRLVDYLVLALAASAVAISAVLSSDTARGLDYLIYFLINLFLLVLASSLRGEPPIRMIAALTALFGVVHLALLLEAGLSNGSSDPKLLIDHAGLATLVVPNDALVLGLCLPSLAWALLNKKQARRIQAHIVLAAYTSLSVFACFMLQSKVALLSLLMAIFCMATAAFLPVGKLVTEKRPFRVLSILSGSILFAGGLAWLLGNQSTTRLSLWMEAGMKHSSLREILFGAGPNTFLFNPSASAASFDKGDFIVPWVHNLYLEAWHDMGLAGLLALIALTLLPILRALRIEDRGVRTMILASMMTFILAAVFEMTLTRRFYFAFLMLFYGLAVSLTKESINVQSS